MSQKPFPLFSGLQIVLCSPQRQALLLSFMVFASGTLHAELPRARLATIFPPGGQIGTTFEVTITGQDLEYPDRLLFPQEGFSAKPKLAAEGNQPEPNKFVVTIGTNVPPGFYEARFVGRFGATNPRLFTVGDQREITEAAEHRSFKAAQEIQINTVVNGRATANAADYFRFTAKKNQLLLIRCLAGEIDSRMDAVLVLLDANESELDRSRRGGLIDFTAPADGAYVIKAHDLLFGGGDEHFYRLSVSTAPRIDFTLPPAVVAGAKTRISLFGRNLPGGVPQPAVTLDGMPLEKLDVDVEAPERVSLLPPAPDGTRLIPPAFGTRGFTYILRTPAGASESVFIPFADRSITAEMEPNQQAEQAQKVTIPCEIGGQFYPKGDVDSYVFEAKKGAILTIEVVSHRLGLPTDPFLLVQRVTRNDKGEHKVTDVTEQADGDANLGGVEFNTASRDPSARVEIKEDGLYRVVVRDLFNRNRSDPRLVYRLILRPETPDFQLAVTSPFPPPANKDAKDLSFWTPLLRRGGTLPLKVVAARRDSFKGDIQLKAEGLPAGVRALETTIPGDKNTATLFLIADETVTNWTGPIRVLGVAKPGETEIRREATAITMLRNVVNYDTDPVRSRVLHDFVLAVSATESEPLSLEPATNAVFDTCVAAKLQIPLTLTRRGEFKQAVKAKVEGLPALDSAKEVEFAANTNLATLELDLTQQKLSAGTHTFHLLSRAPGKYRRITDDEAKAIETTAKTAQEAAKQAEKDIKELAEPIKKANESLAGATKAADEAEAQAKSATEQEGEKLRETAQVAQTAKTAAQKTADELKAKLKAAEKTKAESEKLVKEAPDKTKYQDVSVTIFSTPITIKVAAAPVTMKVDLPSGSLAAGKSIEIPVTIQRQFGFAEAVELSLTPPGETKDVKVVKLTVPKDQTQAKLVLETGPNTAIGELKLSLQAAVKFNGQDLKVEQAVPIKVAAAK
jgi:hypothetical protein